MGDKDLRQSVIDELDFDPSFDAANIGVAAEAGVVTLTGHVRSFAEKLAAFRDAGVQRVYIWPVHDERRQLELFAEEVVPLLE